MNLRIPIWPSSTKSGEFKNNNYKLGVDKVNGSLLLKFYYREDKQNSNWIAVEIPPKVDDKGYRIWDLDAKYINTIYKSDYEKSVYLSVHAYQISEDKIQIENYVVNGGQLCRRTGLTFRDYKIEYVSQFGNCLDHLQQTVENSNDDSDNN